MEHLLEIMGLFVVTFKKCIATLTASTRFAMSLETDRTESHMGMLELNTGKLTVAHMVHMQGKYFLVSK